MPATLTQPCAGGGSALIHRPFPARGFWPRQTIPRRWLFALLAGPLLLGGCSVRESEMLPAPVEGYNHTSASIRFTVNGAGGPNIGPHQGGGKQVCCGALPRHWRPGLRAIVEWEKDPDPYGYAKWPEPMFSDAWQKRAKEHQTHYTRHSATVEIAPYRTPGDLIVHFLPCNQIRVASAEVTPGYPGYPYNYPLNMEEPTVCPQP